ncbi:MAG: hypothetical protein JXR96_26160 [Deltaproteobacteria bacterium]|nr:hypothetical protein [Deltaproteobacteria bacterium]
MDRPWPLLVAFLALTGAGCGDYRALCLEDASAARLEDDRVEVNVTVLNCGLGKDSHWPEGREYCVECGWRDAGGAELDRARTCRDQGIDLGASIDVEVVSSGAIAGEPGIRIEVSIPGANWPGYRPLEIDCP